MNIKIPECNDDAWLRRQVRELQKRLLKVQEGDENLSGDEIDECLEIIDAIQQYAGY